jgi:hypothetical protein
MASFFTSKNIQIFSCEVCDFKCSKKGDYNRHILTAKHKMASFGIIFTSNYIALKCELCDKEYKDRSGLYRHKKKCQGNKILSSDTIKQLVNQNTELHNSLITLSQRHESLVQSTNTTNNINNIHNEIKSNVNINMFLNEQCKNAINFSDFINRIEITHDDLENNAQLGFVQGITKIFMDNLKQLNLCERPIHCTDVKRETMYIRENDTWSKDDQKEKINIGIQEVSRKSLKSLLKWKQNNPEYDDLDSEFSKKCIAMQQQSIAGEKTSVFYPKVIHNLARENALNKSSLCDI